MAALRLYILSNWHLVAIINNAALGVPVVTAAKHGPCYREILEVLRLPSAIQVRASQTGARSNKQSLLVSGSAVHVFSRFVTQMGGGREGGGEGGAAATLLFSYLAARDQSELSFPRSLSSPCVGM